jgi:hypothetical protein
VPISSPLSQVGLSAFVNGHHVRHGERFRTQDSYRRRGAVDHHHRARMGVSVATASAPRRGPIWVSLWLRACVGAVLGGRLGALPGPQHQHPAPAPALAQVLPCSCQYTCSGRAPGGTNGGPGD